MAAGTNNNTSACCTAVENLIRQHGGSLVLYLLWNVQPVETGKYVRDVVRSSKVKDAVILKTDCSP